METRNLGGLAKLAGLAVATGAISVAAWADGGYTSRIKAGDLPASAGKAQAESPEARIEWMKAKMGGELTPEFRSMILDEAKRLQTRGLSPVGGAWTSLGPTNITRWQNGVNKASDVSGRLRTILPDPRPAKANTVYLLSSGGGLWKTTNFGAQKPTWTAKTDGIYATSGGGAAFGRTPDVVYLGTGDPFDLGVGGMMYKSTDAADTWSAPIVLPGTQRILDVKVDTSQGSTTADDIVLVGTDVGLYRSSDGGASYSYVSIDPGTEAYFAYYGGGHEDWSFVKTSAGWLASQAYWQVSPNYYENTLLYYSTDRGATWDYIADTGVLGYSGDAGRTTLAAGGPGGSVVYALSATPGGGNQKDIYKSIDGGQHFTALGMNTKAPTNPNYFNETMNLTHGQGWYNQMLLVDPADATGNTLYAGGNYSSAVSRDGGATWTLLTSWLGDLSAYQMGGTPLLLPYAHADFHAAAISTAAGKRIFFGNDGGIFYSDDNGKSWKDNANQGLGDALIYALSAGTVHPADTLIGLQDNGTLYRVIGTTYTGSIGGDGFGTGWSQANDAISMGSLYYLDIRRWKSNPPNNQSKYDVLLNTSNLAGGYPDYPWYSDSYFVTPIATPTPSADPTGHVFYTNTAHYLLKTANGGDSWSAVWSSADLPDPNFTGRQIRGVSHGIGLSPTDLDYVGLACTSGHFLYTHDGGATWSDVNVAASGLPNWPGYNSTRGWSADNSKVYLASEATFAAPHVASSTDGGATWSNATGDLPQLPINKIVVDPTDPTGNTVYAANWIGVYRTTDGGSHWDSLGTGLPLSMISDMYFSPTGRFLRVSSYGRGVWEIPLN